MRCEEVILAESEKYVGLSNSTISYDEYFSQIIIPKVISLHLKV